MKENQATRDSFTLLFIPITPLFEYRIKVSMNFFPRSLTPDPPLNVYDFFIYFRGFSCSEAYYIKIEKDTRCNVSEFLRFCCNDAGWNNGKVE